MYSFIFYKQCFLSSHDVFWLICGTFKNKKRPIHPKNTPSIKEPVFWSLGFFFLRSKNGECCHFCALNLISSSSNFELYFCLKKKDGRKKKKEGVLEDCFLFSFLLFCWFLIIVYFKKFVWSKFSRYFVFWGFEQFRVLEIFNYTFVWKKRTEERKWRKGFWKIAFFFLFSFFVGFS